MTRQESESSLSAEALHWVARQCGRAPSINNSQPWHLRWDGRHFELFGDRGRQLAVSDPAGRELTISCGAALFNLRMSLSALGCATTCERLPDPAQPDLLARVHVCDHGGMDDPPPPPAALIRRHTHRGAMGDEELPRRLAAVIHLAASHEGAQLHFVGDPGPLRAILTLAHLAEWNAAGDAAKRREAEAWAPTVPSPEGVPASSYPAGSVMADPTELQPRDFDLGRNVGGLEPAASPVKHLAVLCTQADAPLDWVRAGEGLEAALIAAAEEWWFARIHSRVCEEAAGRRELQRHLGTQAFPHLILQFGRGSTFAATPRRPVSEYLEIR